MIKQITAEQVIDRKYLGQNKGLVMNFSKQYCNNNHSRAYTVYTGQLS